MSVVYEADTQRLQAVLAIVRQATLRLEALHDRFSPDGGVALRTVAERLYQERRRRDERFPPGLFGEPAWDMLLVLFMAEEDGREMTVGEAFSAAKVHPDEGPAVIDKLVIAGLVRRCRSRRDARRIAVVLTENGVDRLSDYLADLI
jgi:DNA-binding MarR family transcriptional regulator